MKFHTSKPEQYAKVEKQLPYASYTPHMANPEFKQRLLSELRMEKVHQTVPATAPRQRFGLPYLFPSLVFVTVCAVLVAVVLQFKPDNTLSPIAHTPIVVQGQINPDEIADAFTLEALQKTDSGVDPVSSFELRSTVDTTLEHIREAFQFTPNIAYAIEASDARTYRITPKQPLEADGLVVATLDATFPTEDGTQLRHTYSWSYQVQEEFQVISTLPRDHGSDVPLDSGIEITFSHVGFEVTAAQFSITPAVTGRFETHRKTLVFIPNQPLQTETVYTVRASTDVRLPATDETLGEDVVFTFETTGDSETSDTKGITDLQQITNETSAVEAPTLVVMGNDLDQLERVNLTISTFKDPDDFTHAFNSFNTLPDWTQYARQNWSVPADQLEVYSSGEVPLQDIGNRWQYVVAAPEPLPAGWYVLAVPQHNGKTIQSLLQVTDITAYVTTSETDTVVWVHDALSEEAIADAAVSLADGTPLGATNQDGILQIKTPTQLSDNSATIHIQSGDQALRIPVSQNTGRYWEGDRGDSVSPRFWSYLYVDQPFYRPNDELNFWGLAVPRDGATPGVEVAVEIQARDYSSEEPVVLHRKTLNVGTFGTLEGQISLGNLLPDTYTAVLLINGQNVFAKGFEVLTLAKPAYELSITPQNRGVISGDSFTHTVQASFFDGTPVTNVELQVAEETLKTDDTGTTQYTHDYEATERTNYENIDVHPVLSEEGEISANAQVQVFPSSQIIQVDTTTSGNEAQVNGNLHLLDLEAFNQGEYDFYEIPRGDVVGQYPLSVDVVRHWSEKKESGTRYDFRQKKVVPTYTYTYKNEAVKTQQLTTDVDGHFLFTFTMDDSSNYSFEVSATDGQGRVVKETRSASTQGQEYNMGDYFYLRLTNEESDYGPRPEYSVGETVSTTFFRNDERLPEQSHFLYIQAQDGIRTVTPSDSSIYAFTFGEEHIPNIILQGVWFDGRSYWQTDSSAGMFRSGRTASFREGDKQLNIVITPDKQEYQPGDTVTLDVAVERPNGDTEETVVNFNLIDEAIYAILPDAGFGYYWDYRAGFNEILYRDTDSGILSSYASHRYPTEKSGAEGGGGYDIRTDFPDKAFFQTVTTDSDGKAQVQFTLPDNITSWRITAHAVDEDLYAASSTQKLPVTQPFFVHATLNTTYLVADQPILKVRAFGDELDQRAEVSWTVSAPSLGVETHITTTGSGTGEVTFPALVEGKYDIEIRAESGSFGDGIRRSITVVPSHVLTTVTKVEQVKADWKPTVETTHPIDIIFTDEHIGQFYPYLNCAYCNFGDRLDQLAGRQIAAQLLHEYFEQAASVETFNSAEYQTAERGGLTIFPYSDDDLFLSASVAASLIGADFDSARLADYFEAVLNDASQPTLHHAYSLYGLAALHEPVLFEIGQVLQSDKITDQDRLYLALALAEAGDLDGARVAFMQLQDTYLRTQDQLSYLDIGVTPDEKSEYTLVAANIAALLQDPIADQFFNYSQNHVTRDVELVVMEMNFIEQRLRTLPQSPVRFTFTHLDTEETVELSNGKTRRLTLTPEALADFRVTQLSGAAQAVITYTSPLTTELATTPGISVHRQYEKNPVTDGDLVKVTLNVNVNTDLPEGRYQVTDFIPSGMQIITQPYSHNDLKTDTQLRYPYRIDGQRASFWVSGAGNHTFTYYIRVLSKGTYAAEPALVQSVVSPSIRAIGNAEILTVE